jgi:hypothetical protein
METVIRELEEELDFLIGQMGVTFEHDELMKLSGRICSLYSTIKTIKIKGGNDNE